MLLHFTINSSPEVNYVYYSLSTPPVRGTGSLKLAVVGVFIPQNLANATSWDLIYYFAKC